MKGKDVALIIVSIIAFIELIIIMFLMPVKTIDETSNNNSSQEWKNITTWKGE